MTDLAERSPCRSRPSPSTCACSKRRGLLKRRRLGREHRIELNPMPIQRASDWIDHYRKFWEGSLDSLAVYLENEPKKNKPKKGKKP